MVLDLTAVDTRVAEGAQSDSSAELGSSWAIEQLHLRLATFSCSAHLNATSPTTLQGSSSKQSGSGVELPQSLSQEVRGEYMPGRGRLAGVSKSGLFERLGGWWAQGHESFSQSGIDRPKGNIQAFLSGANERALGILS